MVVWEDEIEEDLSLLERLVKMELMIQELPLLLDKLASAIERTGNALNGTDPLVTTIFIATVIVTCGMSALFLAYASTGLFIWLITVPGLMSLRFNASQGNGYKDDASRNTKESPIQNFLSRIPDAQEAAHRFIASSPLPHRHGPRRPHAQPTGAARPVAGAH